MFHLLLKMSHQSPELFMKFTSIAFLLTISKNYALAAVIPENLPAINLSI